MQLIRNVKFYASLSEDAHQGWVWIRGPSHEPRNVVRLKVSGSHKVVYVEALSIDENFRRRYNQSPRLPIVDDVDAIVVSGWYRDKLGLSADDREASLSIQRSNGPWGKLRACTDHPQLVVRIATWLGLLGLALGLLSLVLALGTMQIQSR